MYQKHVSKSQRFPILSSVIIAAAILVSVLQAIFFTLEGFWTTYTIGSVCLFVSILFLSWKSMSTHNIRIVGLILFLLCIQLCIFGIKLASTQPPFTFRLLQVAIVIMYFMSATVILLAVSRVNALPNISLLLLSVAAAYFLSESGLELLRISKDKNLAKLPHRWSAPEWLGTMETHPDLGFYYAPHSVLKLYYPDNPRGYFKKEEDNRGKKWRLQVQEGNVANFTLFPDGTETMRIVIKEVKTKIQEHIQLNQDRLSVKSNHRYAVIFQARADSSRNIILGFARAHEPWDNLGLYKNIELKPEWQKFNIEFVVMADDDNARIHFDVGGSKVSVELSDVILRSLPDGKTVKPDIPPEKYFVSYRFNALGCRGKDYHIPRPGGTVRIVLLGDSFTMGVGVHEEDTFGYQLERLLNEKTVAQNSGITYEVVNCGVSGFGTREERLFYELFAAKYEPDIVLLSMVWNDEMSFADEIKKGYVNRHPSKLESLFYIWGRIQEYRYKRPFPDFSACVDEILQLKSDVQKQGACLTVVLFRNNSDYGTSYYAKIWDHLAKTIQEGLQGTDIPILDLGEKLREKHPLEDLRVHDIDLHPNEIAHATAAQEILSFLRRKDMLISRRRVH